MDPGFWLDLDKEVQFGLYQNWTNSTSRESFFISDKESFLFGNSWGIPHVLKYYGSVLGLDISANTEMIHLHLPLIEQFENSKILIVGGGPTSKEREWNSDDYDHVFSCNHFYLNEKLRNTNVSFAVFTTETDFSENNIDFHDYMKNNSTLICFEDRMQPEERKYFEFIKNRYPTRAMYAHTRYRGKIGAVPRLLCMATLFGAREIHVVGMDGLKKESKAGEEINHAFQKNKKILGTADYDLYRRHYVALWDYLLSDIGVNVKYQNLGEGHESNMTTDISRQMFPLEDKNV